MNYLLLTIAWDMIWFTPSNCSLTDSDCNSKIVSSIVLVVPNSFRMGGGADIFSSSAKKLLLEDLFGIERVSSFSFPRRLDEDYTNEKIY